MLYAGCEADILGQWGGTQFVQQLAIENNAAILYTEHRYYGDSFPFENDNESNENVKYLTTDNALVDNIQILR